MPKGANLVLAQCHECCDHAGLFRGAVSRRLRIEECFKHIKARLRVENWSGVLPHAVEQDFYASLVCANCAAAVALEADPGHASLYPPTPDGKGWRRALNCTLVIKSLRHALPRLLMDIDIVPSFQRQVSQELRVEESARRRRSGSEVKSQTKFPWRQIREKIRPITVGCPQSSAQGIKFFCGYPCGY